MTIRALFDRRRSASAVARRGGAEFHGRPGRRLAVLAAGLWILVLAGLAVPAAGRGLVIAPSRFDNQSGDSGLDWLGVALWDLTCRSLGSVPGIEVASWDLQYEFLGEEGFRPDGALDRSEAERLAVLFGADYAVAGSFESDGASVTVEATVSAPGAGAAISIRAAGTAAGLEAMVTDLAVKVLAAAGAEGGPSPIKENAEAFRAWARGINELIAGRPEAGVEAFKAALEHDPGHVRSLSRLALVDSALGSKESALEHINRAVESAESGGDAALLGETLNMRSTLHRAAGDIESARVDLDRAVELLREAGGVKELGAALMNRAPLSSMAGDLGAALADLEAAERIYAGHGVSWATAIFNQGLLYDEFGRREQARERLLAAESAFAELGARSRQASALRRLGAIEREYGDNARALEYYEKSLPLFAAVNNELGASYAMRGMAVVLTRLGRYDEAYRGLERAFKTQREYGDIRSAAQTLSDLGVLFHHQGMYEDAAQTLMNALDVFEQLGDGPAAAGTVNNLAQVLQDLGRYEEAVEAFEASLELSRTLGLKAEEARALNNLGIIFGILGDRDLSKEFLEQARALAEAVGDRIGLSRVYSNIAMIHEQHREYEMALEGYAKALAILEPMGETVTVGVVLSNKGQVYDRMGEQDRALEYYRRAVEKFESVGRSPQMAAPLINIGVQHGLAGRWAEAEESFRSALELGTTRFAEYGAMVNLAWTLIATGRLDEAGPLLEEAAASLPTQAAAHAHLGYVLLRRGEPEAAGEHIRRAMELDPEYHESRLYRGIYRYEVENDIPGAIKDLEAAVEIGTWLPELADQYLEKVKAAQ